MSLMSYTSKYMGNPGGTITTVTNDKLSWETSYNTNVGIDFGFFGHLRPGGGCQQWHRQRSGAENRGQSAPA